MTGLPTTPKVEIEFTAGVWTDVTADVQPEYHVRYGRSSEFSTAQTATFDFVLDNLAGNYLPKNGASAYYPNVIPRKRVRFTLSSGTVPVFFGYIKSWSPQFDDGQPITLVTASDRWDQLGRVGLGYAVDAGAAAAASVTSHFRLDDSSMSRLYDRYGNATANLIPVSSGLSSLVSAAWMPRDGAPYLISDDLPGARLEVQSAAVAGSTYAYECTGLPAFSAVSFGIWLTIPASSAFQSLSVTLNDQLSGSGNTNLFLSLLPTVSSKIAAEFNSTATVRAELANSLPQDGLPHHYAVTWSGTTTSLYLDGVLLATASGAPSTGATARYLSFAGSAVNLDAAFDWGSLVIANAAWSGPTVAALYNAGAGYPGEKSGARVTRLLQSIGLVGADYNIDAGQETMGGGSWHGRSIGAALDDITTSEGGGSVSYVAQDGRVRFIDRRFRDTATPVFTFDAENDLSGDDFAPMLDDTTLVNSSSVTRDNAGQQGPVQTYTDTASRTTYGLFSDSASTGASTDAAALLLAQDRVARQANPGLRLDRFSVDFITATTAGLYTTLGSLAIGTRVRITGIATSKAGAPVFPFSQMDAIVEGWEISATSSSWVVTFDTSPADAPARALWSDSAYGRWSSSNQTLTSTIASGATSMSVTTSSGPTLSTSAGDYPMKVQLHEEVVTISSAPAGSSSPQTVTISRASNGTTATSHTAGASIALAPLGTWSL